MINIKEIKENRAAIFGLSYLQMVLTLVLSMFLYFSDDKVSAYSLLLGGMIYILPTLGFVQCVFSTVKQQTPQLMAILFYIGEVVKIILTAVLFLLCFLFVSSLNVPLLFVTYIAMMVTNLIGMAVIGNNISQQYLRIHKHRKSSQLKDIASGI